MKRLLFKGSILFSIVVLFFLFLLPGNSPIDVLNHQEYVCFKGGGDFFADFFNVQRYISENDPYFSEIGGQSEKPYLPFCYLIMKPFNHCCDYVNMSLRDCWESPRAVFSAILFLLISLFFFFDSFLRLNYTGRWKSYHTLLLMFTSVFLFSIERGNLIILAVAGVNYFLAFYESERIWIRRLGLLCLCIASVIKVYPALLGILLLKEKRYNDIIFCLCCGIILSVVPFFFFEHGLENIPRLIDNLRVNGEVYGSAIGYQFGVRPLSSIFAKMMSCSDSTTSLFMVFTKICTLLLAISSIALAYLEDRKWMQLALLLLTIILIPTNSYFYTGMFLFPFIMVFVNNDCILTWREYVLILLLCLILNPVQIVYNSVSITTVIANICCVFLWLFLIVSSGIHFLKFRKIQKV